MMSCNFHFFDRKNVFTYLDGTLGSVKQLHNIDFRMLSSFPFKRQFFSYTFVFGLNV